MPNQITAAGLETADYAELLAYYTTGYETIYGSDINLDQDSPDGQYMGIQIQAILDILDVITQVYNSFDPDLAIGNTLDMRVAINGIQRQAGTYTTTNITLVVSQALSLQGLSSDPQEPYTVADNAGNNWILQTDQNPPSAGTYVYEFRSEKPGAVLTTPNTINVPVTVVLGIVSINNPTTYSTLGLNEETDAALRIRRQKSVAIGSQGYYAGLLAALENVTGVTAAFIYENLDSITNVDGVPGHSIWVIVTGSYLDADVANAIYAKRNAGCGMFGAVNYTITQIDGSPFVISWDVVVPEDLYIKFDASSLDGTNAPDTAAILAQLPVTFAPGVHAEVNINELATLVQQIDPNTLVTNAGFSFNVGGPFTNTLTPTAKNKQFAVSTPNISITVV